MKIIRVNEPWWARIVWRCRNCNTELLLHAGDAKNVRRIECGSVALTAVECPMCGSNIILEVPK